MKIFLAIPYKDEFEDIYELIKQFKYILLMNYLNIYNLLNGFIIILLLRYYFDIYNLLAIFINYVNGSIYMLEQYHQFIF